MGEKKKKRIERSLTSIAVRVEAQSTNKVDHFTSKIERLESCEIIFTCNWPWKYAYFVAPRHRTDSELFLVPSPYGLVEEDRIKNFIFSL